ncbi:MAG: hypothetical protein Q7R47_03275, partial [Candidatus Diapherotrites archaeon]|nr:hypothetical protein [Candidatus Diapherotrites archaeon]
MRPRPNHPKRKDSGILTFTPHERLLHMRRLLGATRGGRVELVAKLARTSTNHVLRVRKSLHERNPRGLFIDTPVKSTV